MDRKIPPDAFPFAERSANMMAPDELNDSYRRLFELDARSFTDSEYQFVWHHSDVREVLQARNDNLTVKHSLVPRVGFGALALYPGNWLPFARDLVPLPAHATADNTDPTSHARIWKAMAGTHTGYLTTHSSPEFMDRHFEAALALQTQGIGGEVRIDVSSLAIDYSARLVAEMVGVPKEQWPDIKRWSQAQSGLLGQRVPHSEQPQAIASLGQLFRLGKQLVRASIEGADEYAKEDTYIRHLLDQGVPPAHAVSVFANSVAAGVFTISGSLQLSTEGLLDPATNFENWGRLGANSQVMPVTNEALRLYPGLIAWPRYATKEVTLSSGTTLRKGAILALTGAANRDPDVIISPNEFSVHRPANTAASSLTFGKGAHQCPGQDPSRRAVAAFLSGLHAAVPDAELIEHPHAHKPVTQDRLFNSAQVMVRASRLQAL